MEERLVKILMLAFVLRVIISPFTAHLWDLYALQEALYYTISGENVYEVVYQKTRMIMESTNMSLFYEGYAYPPHAIYLLMPFYVLYLLTGADPRPIEVDSPVSTVDLFKYLLSKDFFLYSLFIKMPMIIADMIVISLLHRADRKLAVVYAFSPYSITISSAWGMFDPIVGLFLLLAVALRQNPFLSGLALGLSLMKPYAAVAVPPFLIYTLRERGYEGALRLFAGLALSQIPTIVYLILSPREFLSVVVTFHALRPPSGLTPLRILTLAESPSIVSIFTAIHAAISIALYAMVLRSLAARGAGLLESVISSLSFFLSMSKVVHQQYYASLFPLLLLCSARRAIMAELLFFIYTTITVLPLLFTPTFMFIAAYVVVGVEVVRITEHILGGWRIFTPLFWFPLSVLSFFFFLKIVWDISRGRVRCSSSIY